MKVSFILQYDQITQVMIREKSKYTKSFTWCSLIYRTSIEMIFAKILSLCHSDSIFLMFKWCFFEAPIETALSYLIFAPLIALHSSGTGVDRIWAVTHHYCFQFYEMLILAFVWQHNTLPSLYTILKQFHETNLSRLCIFTPQTLLQTLSNWYKLMTSKI